jgi:hypothetical protein
MPDPAPVMTTTLPVSDSMLRTYPMLNERQ